MKKRKFFAAIGTAVLIGASGVASFAADNTGNNAQSGAKLEVRNELRTQMKSKVREYLDQALKDGKITQEQYDNMIKMQANSNKTQNANGRNMRNKDNQAQSNGGRKGGMGKNRSSKDRRGGLACANMNGVQFTEEQKSELKAIREKILTDSLKAGKITQDEFDRMMSRSFDRDVNSSSDSDLGNMGKKMNGKKAVS